MTFHAELAHYLFGPPAFMKPDSPFPYVPLEAVTEFTNKMWRAFVEGLNHKTKRAQEKLDGSLEPLEHLIEGESE